jgi:large subunit ribosomal protein L25
MSEMTIEVTKREEFGKNANRRLRASGLVPAVVYGQGKEPVPIQVETRRVQDLLRKTDGDNPVFLLKMAGTQQSRHTMIRQLDADPINGNMIHIDFQRINMDETVRISVGIELHGLAYGVKNEDGIMDFVTREVEVECKPDKIPGHLEIDVTGLHVGQHLEVGDLEMPEGVTLHDDESRVIVSVVSKQREVVEETEGEDLLTAQAQQPELVDEDAG